MSDVTKQRRIAVSLSEEQQHAAHKITDFISDAKGGDFFVIHGLAGSGKTVLLSHIARKYPDSILATITGKAASILRNKTGLSATTIHSAIYKLREEKPLPNNKYQLEWDLATQKDAWKERIVLLDECSTINEDIARDILSTGAKIIACGDPGQLPPVKGNPFFNRPDILLHEIHRQAMDSPIIRQAHNVRFNNYYNEDTDLFRVVSHVPAEEIIGADVMLTWKNATRHQLNYLKRAHLGIAQSTPLKSEPVMCLMNNKALGLFNGATYELAKDYTPYSNTIHITIDGIEIEVYNTFFENIDDQNRKWTRSVTPFTFGYAMTVHKAQGSEWNNVILADEYGKQDGWCEWCYTGITRASERILIQRNFR